MANQTVSVNRNIDDSAISGLANGETVTVNTNAVLTINSDSRWGQQAAVLGALTIDSGTGGTVNVDGRDVWWIPYDGGTGNVPALGTAGTLDVTRGGSSVAEFLGVWTALGVAPSTAGGAMPASGFIKLRRKTVTFSDNDVLTFTGGATATVNSTTGGQRGWLHVVGTELATITVPRLGSFNVTGDWFELGTTNGANNQTFQHYAADHVPAIQIETSPGSGVYEWWLNAGSKWNTATQYISTDARGKFFGCTSAGVITLASTTSYTSGALPASGCKVRVPNIHISNSNSTNWTLNPISTTLATRWDFTTTSSGAINMDKCLCNAFVGFSQAYSVSLTFVATLDQISLQEIPTSIIIEDCAVGMQAANTNYALYILTAFGGASIKRNRMCRYSLAASGNYGIYLQDCDGLSIEDNRFEALGNTTATTRGNAATGVVSLNRVYNSTFKNTTLVGGRVLVSVSSGLVFENTIYADVHIGAVSTTNGMYVIDFSGGGNADCLVDGISWMSGITNIHAYSGVVGLSNSQRIKVKNIGTASAPLNCGSANAAGLLAYVGGNTIDCEIRRCYSQNTRSGVVSSLNSDFGLTLVNVWGDAADAPAIAANNGIYQGLRATPAAGQTAVYGTHWLDAFTSTTAGRVLIMGNEPTAFSADQCQATAGTPKFTSTGQVKLATVGDQIVWTMPYFCLGYTAFTNSAPTLTGTNTGNLTYEFQIDVGSGFNGSWLTLNAANLIAQTITATVGFRLKVRATCATAAAANALTSILIAMTTDATSQQTQYALPGILLTLTGLSAGSDVVVYAAGTGTIRGSVDANATSSWVYSYTTQENVDIGVFKPGYVPFYIRNYALGAADASLPVAQVVDRAYVE